MKVLEASIEDNPRNYTRFAIIAAHEEGTRRVTKSSIIFSTGNKPGALFSVMKVFSDQDINMVKLESRPMLGKPWEYMFYADIEADVAHPDMAGVMELLQEKAENLRVLGRY